MGTSAGRGAIFHRAGAAGNAVWPLGDCLSRVAQPRAIGRAGSADHSLHDPG